MEKEQAATFCMARWHDSDSRINPQTLRDWASVQQQTNSVFRCCAKIRLPIYIYNLQYAHLSTRPSTHQSIYPEVSPNDRVFQCANWYARNVDSAMSKQQRFQSDGTLKFTVLVVRSLGPTGGNRCARYFQLGLCPCCYSSGSFAFRCWCLFLLRATKHQPRPLESCL